MQLGKLPFLAAALCGASAAHALVEYRVAVLPDQNRINVEMSFVDPGAREVNLQMPNWMPGLYILWPSGNNVHDFQASGDHGPLNVKHPDTNSWTISAANAGTIRVSYWVPSQGGFGGLGPARASLPDYIQISGPTTYLYVSGRKEEPCRIQFEVPNGWPVMTGLDATRSPNTFNAPNYDTLADNPVDTGNLIVQTYQLAGKDYYVVIGGPAKDQIDRAKLVQDCRFVSAAETDFWGGAPYRKYVWMFTVQSSRGGMGLEHLSSTQITLPYQLDSESIGFLAHEYFHLWNVKRIRPFDLGPFDYTKLPRTGALWWLEGVTDYYANLLPYRYGAWDRAQFFGSILKNYGEVEKNPARLSVSPYEASEKVGDAAGGRGNSNGYEISYYNLGWLCGLCLDIEIRSQSNGKRSLDDVIHGLYDICKDGKPGFQPGEIRRQCVRFGGPALGPFYDRIVMKAGELPVSGELAKAGFRMSSNSIAEDPTASGHAQSLGKAWLYRKVIRFSE